MALPSCKRCGTQDPQRMYGLMSLWFGPLVNLEAELGYFHLCPMCHDEFIAPELERIQNRILELHPAAARTLDEMEMAPAELYEEETEAASKPDAADGGGPSDQSEGANEQDTADDQGAPEEEDAPDRDNAG